MDYITAHKEFLQLIKLENTSTVEPEEFEKYFNNAQESFVRDNYMMGSDSKQMIIDNIQHLRICTDSKHVWKNNLLDPMIPDTSYSMKLPMSWGYDYTDVNGDIKELPKYLRLESMMARIIYGESDPCKRTGVSDWKKMHYLKSRMRGSIKENPLRVVSNDRIYYHLAGNNAIFDLYGTSEIHSIQMEYYRCPVDIAYNNGTGAQSADSPDYPQYNSAAEIINPELTTEDIRIVLRIAARYYLEGVKS